MMKRLVHFVRTFFALFELRYSPRAAVLEAAFDLQRLNHRLFEISQSIKRPADMHQMVHDRVPRTVEAEIWSSLDMVRSELTDAIDELVKVAEVTEEGIRSEYFSRHGGGL